MLSLVMCLGLLLARCQLVSIRNHVDYKAAVHARSLRGRERAVTSCSRHPADLTGVSPRWIDRPSVLQAGAVSRHATSHTGYDREEPGSTSPPAEPAPAPWLAADGSAHARLLGLPRDGSRSRSSARPPASRDGAATLPIWASSPIA